MIRLDSRPCFAERNDRCVYWILLIGRTQSRTRHKVKYPVRRLIVSEVLINQMWWMRKRLVELSRTLMMCKRREQKNLGRLVKSLAFCKESRGIMWPASQKMMKTCLGSQTLAGFSLFWLEWVSLDNVFVGSFSHFLRSTWVRESLSCCLWFRCITSQATFVNKNESDVNIKILKISRPDTWPLMAMYCFLVNSKLVVAI